MEKITKYVNGKAFFDENVANKYINYLVNFIKDKVKSANLNGAVVGISGGIDSTLVAALAKKALGQNFIGVIMPINDMSHDLEHIKKLEKNLEMNFISVNLQETNLAINKAINVKNSLAIANIMPRLRMTTLYAIAQENNSLVLGTDNKDEFFIGYFTKYGDGGVDILPICHLTKQEVRFLASLLNVPNEILEKKPSAGLWENQSDEAELGFSYKDLDFYLDHIEDQKLIKKTLSSTTISKIEKMHKISQHKRDGAYQPLDVDKID
ncbi:NAD+ synthase [Mycoplasmopsis alligatoris]|uniref:NH(3)-dependent NAD(+) synthetase n=1 Tax=Mycoplasmopsis alligatoris A21JP2 TaxID=747682 RepID=D4XW42_9BACT|nr:NAD+ synthase [Mycoplasmopsis alligatoris]EFF41414.1 NAD+ synthetase [Mycoplasmopsis alligatoris A21JP2]